MARSATDASVARVLVGVMCFGLGAYGMVRLLGRSRFAVPIILVVAVLLVIGARALWHTRRASLESEARQREAEFLRTTLPKRAHLPNDDLSS